MALALALAGGAQAQSNLTWSATTKATGTGLILAPKGGEAVFSLACVRGTGEVLAIAYKAKPDAGQEMNLSFGDQLFVFVVKPQALKDGKMLQAAAKAGPELLAAVHSGKAISLAYGKTKLGPYPPPPAAMGDSFAQQCGPLV